jgi:uncharacterized membrane protein
MTPYTAFSVAVLIVGISVAIKIYSTVLRTVRGGSADSWLRTTLLLSVIFASSGAFDVIVVNRNPELHISWRIEDIFAYFFHLALSSTFLLFPWIAIFLCSWGVVSIIKVNVATTALARRALGPSFILYCYLLYGSWYGATHIAP